MAAFERTVLFYYLFVKFLIIQFLQSDLFIRKSDKNCSFGKYDKIGKTSYRCLSAISNRKLILPTSKIYLS